MEFDLDSSSSQVTPKQLAALRSWIDTFPFMNEEKKKGFRSIGRDFADGVRVAKIIKVFLQGHTSGPGIHVIWLFSKVL